MVIRYADILFKHLTTTTDIHEDHNSKVFKMSQFKPSKQTIHLFARFRRLYRSFVYGLAILLSSSSIIVCLRDLNYTDGMGTL